VGAPRIAFAVAADPADEARRLFLHVKNNLAAAPQGLAFRVEQAILGEPGKAIVASRLKWDAAPVSISADEAMAAANGGAGGAKKVDSAEAFLREELAEGPVAWQRLKSDADGAGLSWASVRRAKEKLGVVSSRIGGIAGDGEWEWSLP
jgi:hypothetical protein